MTKKVDTVNLLTDKTTTGAGTAHDPSNCKRSYQGFGSTSSGAGSATIDVEVSNDNTNWITQGTITLTLATTVSDDGFTTDAPWKYVRGNVTAISGTGAKVSLILGNGVL